MYFRLGKRYYQLLIIPQVLIEARALSCSGEIQLAFFYLYNSMKITILHNPRCSKSRTALQEAQACNYEIEIVEYLKDTPSVAELKNLLKKLGLKPEAIVRKKEPLFVEKFAGKKYTDTQWIKILHDNPVLIERPIIVKGDEAILGRSQEQLDSILK